jgi:hypothetical protein
MNRYSRHRPFIESYVLRRKLRIIEEDSAGHVEKGSSGSALRRISAKKADFKDRKSGLKRPENRSLKSGRKSPDGRWFALGPVYVGQVMRAASRGGYAVAAWLAVRALEGAGVPATVAEIVKTTGMGERDARRAAAALVELRMLKREGKTLSTGEQR